MKLIQVIFVGTVFLIINHSAHAANRECNAAKEEYETLWASLEEQGHVLDTVLRDIVFNEGILGAFRSVFKERCHTGITVVFPMLDSDRKICNQLKSQYNEDHHKNLREHDQYRALHAIFLEDLVRWEELGGQIESECREVSTEPQVDSGSGDNITGEWDHIAGVWHGGGESTYKVKIEGNGITWDGEGKWAGKDWQHKGKGTISGNTIRGEFADVEDSAFESSGSVSGRISKNGREIRWTGFNPREAVWKR